VVRLCPLVCVSEQTARGAVSAASRRFQIRKCAAVRTIPVTTANTQENSTTSMTSLVMIRSPRNTPPSLARLRPLLKVGGKVTVRCQNLSSGIPVGLVCAAAPLHALAPNQFQSTPRLARRNMVANTKPIVIMTPQMAPTTKVVINQAVDASHILCASMNFWTFLSR
jgi:hypothetical protein